MIRKASFEEVLTKFNAILFKFVLVKCNLINHLESRWWFNYGKPQEFPLEKVLNENSAHVDVGLIYSAEVVNCDEDIDY